MKVLIVEDNADAGAMLALLLTQFGYECRNATRGESALLLVPEWKPDVVLLDLSLPGMDGYEVARRLRQEAGLTIARIFAMSGHAVNQAKQQAAGIQGHLLKPVKLRDLQSLIEAD